MEKYSKNNDIVHHEHSSTESINAARLKEIAKLVKIRLSDHEIKYYSNQLEKVVSWFNIISQVDTNDVPPMYYGNPFHKLITRQDIVNDGNVKDQVLSNTKSEYGYFVVPKVM
ncbi:Asp-tRNA(Asn)/Glu-tRNA(Gln) amidotransferase subunit GatC [Neoehrlichia mikurensis]|uniref:Asp-tRNA(Asn)/Glu-tRNA(Gln) amidotransferase subunit GatC n=1 Tax=Neoehrlichia mikurensis TaxID=89586 RepID=A0A9Q9BYC3_9RICK|nr:Asp-tRNA(Asn)/Glu-tRNA(Gln) amidotransferase subunit GatC [Neoehrlichia mikurensis]QXK91655.1 Asp-tRNA(Asn)/Glu-tRNA(Gln) amidotransferase subunit GatC [Neoehrlichia mikurensis]QXK92866.1 Asp-tRNA(Asn)/Glu-tRNA(Gln) amidotransferase subunit GatC [Neoehrlichia mikurensis]QXK93346.1 Asp-tRNA(Asn)/Glu-tRNA(Gln) amidotransferase subunit GatC [Neoehrlichia mikurensis]UTO55711.1 Asp-tRNA(Asn)/Glu-tRNA(Gln) amidotransferase subunit GatC [Neoehrlichia mikurensis]UTO56628.1 Asp-tRNA(Asn)/Glu-tRNA(Gl